MKKNFKWKFLIGKIILKENALNKFYYSTFYNMRKSAFLLTILLLYSFQTIVQTTISGDISGLTFKSVGNPWMSNEYSAIVWIGNIGFAVISNSLTYSSYKM